jgi:glycosyltransferase involved in cell wall biosynthesis
VADAATSTEVLHTHGLWLMANIAPAAAARNNGRLFVISPRGMLGPAALQFSRRKKQLVWKLLQGRAAHSAGLLHATSEAEFEEIRAAGLNAPVAVIANGVDVPRLERERTPPPQTVLSLGRIHPKKGLDRLVRAWSLLGPVAQGWSLRIVGPDQGGYARELARLVDSLRLVSVTIEPPLFGVDKLAAYQEAAVFVLPILNENFAMTVAEALAAGVPVIATKGAPWSGLTREGCGWWVDHGERPLAEALMAAMTLRPQERAAMGLRGRDWMARDFSWDRLGAEMLAAYQWALGKGPQPDTIRE